MKFDLRKPMPYYGEWEKKFAWLPVYTSDDNFLVWLEFIETRKYGMVWQVRLVK